jgi:hypothetical protein
MADYFVYSWDDGTTTEIELPEDYAHCDQTTPSDRMMQFAQEIVAQAQNSDNPHENEQYILAARSPIAAMIPNAETIADYWSDLKKGCADWKCECAIACWCAIYKWCTEKGRYCYMSEDSLRVAREVWKNIPSMLANQLSQLDYILQEVHDQIQVDLQQATDQALLDQLIAETNQIISLTAYQNEVREIAAAKEKTQDIFAPIVITLVVAAVSFYLIKK